MLKLTTIVFIIVAPTLAGILITIGLSMPQLGLIGFKAILALALVGAVVAIPVSRMVAGRIAAMIEGQRLA